MYYSLLMQAIRADPALYVAMVKLRADNNTRLIAFPCPGRYYAEGQNIRRCFYEGDAYSLSTTRALCDEFVFLGETKTVTYQNETSGAQVQEFIDAIYEGKNFAEFIPDDSEAYQAFEIFQDNLADHGVDPIRHESAALGMQVFNSGSLIHYNFEKLERTRFSLLVNYITVDKDRVYKTEDRY